MELREQITKLMATDISSYRIAQDSGVPYSTISNIRTGKRGLDDLSLKNAERLGSLFQSLPTKTK